MVQFPRSYREAIQSLKVIFIRKSVGGLPTISMRRWARLLKGGAQHTLGVERGFHAVTLGLARGDDSKIAAGTG